MTSTILSVDHFTIHIPAIPMTIITNPKVMFVTKSGERPIITAIKVRIRNGCEESWGGLRGKDSDLGVCAECGDA